MSAKTAHWDLPTSKRWGSEKRRREEYNRCWCWWYWNKNSIMEGNCVLGGVWKRLLLLDRFKCYELSILSMLIISLLEHSFKWPVVHIIDFILAFATDAIVAMAMFHIHHGFTHDNIFKKNISVQISSKFMCHRHKSCTYIFLRLDSWKPWHVWITNICSCVWCVCTHVSYDINHFQVVPGSAFCKESIIMLWFITFPFLLSKQPMSSFIWNGSFLTRTSRQWGTSSL